VIEMDVKVKRNGRWCDLDVGEFTDKTLFNFLVALDGTEARIRVKDTEKNWTAYIAGTREIAESLRQQGEKRGLTMKIYTPLDFVNEARTRGMGDIFLQPTPECFPALFPGATIEQIDLQGELF